MDRIGWVPLYSDVEVRRNRDTNALHVRYFGGRLDGVEVVISEDDMPCDVDCLAKEILRPACEQVIEGSFVELPDALEASFTL